MVESNCWLKSQPELQSSLAKTRSRDITIYLNNESCSICKKVVNALAGLSGHRRGSFGFCVAPQMGEGLSQGCFRHFAAAVNLAHQHRSLDGSDAEVRQLIFLCVLREARLSLLADKK